MIRAAPEKFLYLNALGWNATLDADAPGPRWYEPLDLQRGLFQRAVREGAAALWRRAESQPNPPLVAFAAVLRAHGSWLPASDFPRLEAAAAPADLPPQAVPSVDLTFRVDDGTSRHLPTTRLAGQWDRGVVRFHDMREFTRGFLSMLESDEEDLAELDAKALAATTPARRYEVAVELFGECRPLWDQARVDQVLEREVRAQAEAGRPLLAAALRARYGAQPVEQRLDRGRAALQGVDPATFGAVELREVLVELARPVDPDLALALTREIGGETWGAAVRAIALLRQDRKAEALEVAQGITLPGLRRRILATVR